mmetsp:Transcript_41564/g.90646  ORF Transcript_41564/g.90646 Transcript_41564/m.90646 type:complete len:252 (-) Transcript_41564:478-1233(-)
MPALGTACIGGHRACHLPLCSRLEVAGGIPNLGCLLLHLFEEGHGARRPQNVHGVHGGDGLIVDRLCAQDIGVKPCSPLVDFAICTVALTCATVRGSATVHGSATDGSTAVCGRAFPLGSSLQVAARVPHLGCLHLDLFEELHGTRNSQGVHSGYSIVVNRHLGEEIGIQPRGPLVNLAIGISGINGISIGTEGIGTEGIGSTRKGNGSHSYAVTEGGRSAHGNEAVPLSSRLQIATRIPQLRGFFLDLLE